jgi:putative multiple sugar transport system substrate-binding protein
MTERDVFERRLEAAVREFVEAAPTRIDAARLTDSLATSVPRVRRLVPLFGWRLPNLGAAWVLMVVGLLALLAMGLIATGALRDDPAPTTPPAPSAPLASPPAVVVTPVAQTPLPSPPASPASPSPAAPSPATPSPAAPPIGIVMPSGWIPGEASRFGNALDAAAYAGTVLASSDVASERAQVQVLLRQGIKVLVLCPQDSAAATAAADEARAAGVTVIANGRPILGTASVDAYVDFDNGKVGAAMGQYLVDRAGATRGNSLYLYAGNAADNNSFTILAGAWRRLQPKIADGTFVIRNSSAATELAAKPTLGRAELARIIGQVTTNWGADTARTLAAGNLATARAVDKRTIFVLAPNDTTARAIGDAIAADGGVTRSYVTGQDADQASVQAIIDGSQGMTVFKDPRTRVQAVVAAAAAFLEGRAPDVNTTLANGATDVPSLLLAPIAVTRDNVQAVLFTSGYYRAGDFTGSWPGKP